MKETRKCTKCKHEKPKNEFHKDNRIKIGIRAVCKSCDSIRYREWYKRNPHKGAKLKSKYGVNRKNWQKMWDLQNGKCMICHKDFASSSNACIDHNHKSGEIRGLLCPLCNTAIGLMRENPIILQSAANYLLSKDDALGGLLTHAPRHQRRIK